MPRRKAPPGWEAPFAGEPGLLDGTLDHALYDVLLGEDVEDDDGEHRQQGGDHDEVPLLDEGADEALHGQGDGADLAVGAQQQQRQQVVVPDPQAVQHQHRDEHGLKQRQHDPEEGSRPGAAVDVRRFFQFQRNTLDESGKMKIDIASPKPR